MNFRGVFIYTTVYKFQMRFCFYIERIVGAKRIFGGLMFFSRKFGTLGAGNTSAIGRRWDRFMA